LIYEETRGVLKVFAMLWRDMAELCTVSEVKSLETSHEHHLNDLFQDHQINQN
jgi:hypothetical protein